MAVRRMEDAGTAAPLRRAAAAYREVPVILTPGRRSLAAWLPSGNLTGRSAAWIAHRQPCSVTQSHSSQAAWAATDTLGPANPAIRTPAQAYVAAHDAQQASGPEAQQRADVLRAQLQQYCILSSDDAFRCDPGVCAADPLLDHNACNTAFCPYPKCYPATKQQRAICGAQECQHHHPLPLMPGVGCD
jgi:hypothetical protein